ncbi:MAG TPA: F0F1 ATP synthase subunit A, partial [Candidatus Eisenbacteria bacterium]|nr:F0F1 ATP synthase subunit A [Candidatus Eisenbacteria bacterium]
HAPAPAAHATVAAVAPAASAAPATPADAHAAEPEHKSEGAPEFPTLISLLEAAFPNAGWVKAVVWFEPLLFSLVIALLLIWAVRAATRHPQMIPGRLQNLVEYAVQGLNDFVTGILGPEQAPRFVPLLGTLFIYILAMNLFGLVPLMKSPTSSLNVTVALALTVFVYVQWIGLRGLGPIGYVRHLMGSPSDVTGWLLVPIMLPIHILGELAKPISLSCRLFGNVFGEDMLLVAFATLGITMLQFAHVPFGLPLHAIFFPLALLSSALQALVFTVLSTIYILLMLPHDHGHGAEDEVLAHSPV